MLSFFPCRRLFSFFLPIVLILCIAIDSLAQNYVFAQLTGTPLNTTGWNLQGDASVTDVTGTGNSELLICSARGFASGAIFYNQPINLSMCNKWIAEFDFRMNDGTGADGIAFCFLDVPPSGYVVGGGLGIPSSANGLKVCFDTWNNCIPFNASTVHQDMPKIEIRWGKGYVDNSNPLNPVSGECLTSEPTKNNADGSLSFIRSPNYIHAKITYDKGNIQVLVNGILYLSGYQEFNFTGYLGFTASTGGYNDNHSIKNVIIYTEMPPSFAGNKQSFCPHDTIQIGGPAIQNYNYSWSPSMGLSDSTVSNPYLTIPVDSIQIQNYTYFVKTSFKSKQGCASTDSVAIKVYPIPKINFSTPEICLTDAIAQFYDSTSSPDNTTLPFSYQWNFGDPNADAANPNSSAAKNPFHRYSAASDYQLSLAVTNSYGCRAMTSKIFTVNGVVPKAAFSIRDAPILCSNTPVVIKNESSVDFGSIGKVQIFWGDSASIYHTDDQTFLGKLYSHSYPNPVSSGINKYKIRMISFSGITCQNEFDQEVTVHPSPHVLFNAIPHVCDNDSAFFITQATELSQLAGSQSFSGKAISPVGLFSPKQAGEGKYSLVYKFIAEDGCADSAIQSITVIAHPIVKAGNDTSIVINQPLQLNAVTRNNTESFLWSPITGLDNPGIPKPIATLGSAIDSIKYFVKATDTAGCYGETSIKVKVFKTLPNIFVPNAFTPGNTINNVFRPIAVGISSIQYFRIYNRWGQLLYSTSHLGDGWDGRVTGRLQETGTYVWMVRGTTYSGITISKRGTVILIK